MSRAARLVAVLLVWLPVLVYAVVTTHQFFYTANSAVHISTDDAVGNISYALATEGRYGFLSSPLLTGLSRHDGVFSYGPFYFYLGAGVIWLFGYSIVALRAIHLVIILGIAAAGGVWFRKRAAGAVGALMAVGLLMAFERAQWPMVRPDIVVSFFAVALVICAGIAIRTGRTPYWAGAGLAAACGAFTHLVAWALVPAAVIVLGVGHLADAKDDDGRWRWPARIWQPVVALAAGGILGAFAFYGSFGFRVSDQLAFLTEYQQYTGSLSELADPGGSFRDLIQRHFEAAYWYLPYPMAYFVWATLLAAIAGVTGLVVWAPAVFRRSALAMLAPPTIVWVVYFASLGVYNNFHAGYAVLNQVMWLWTGAALVAAGLDVVTRWPTVQRAASVAVWLLSLTIAWGMLTVFAQRTNYRALAADVLTPIDEYVSHVLDAVPARARAWGTVDFGIEHPGRIQLIQFWDGIKILEVVDPESRARLFPDYLVWGQVENGMNAAAVLEANEAPRLDAALTANMVGPWRLFQAFPDVRYSLVSIVAAPPYGVTRVYAWNNAVPPLQKPLVSVYDAAENQWNSALGASLPIATTDAPPATLRNGPAQARSAIQTLQGELAPGQYLLKIRMSAALAPDSAAVVVASAGREIQGDITQAAAGIDVSPWFVDESAVYLVYQHPGGSFHVSQFGTRPGAMLGVEASPVLEFTNYTSLRREVPVDRPLASSQWVAAFPETVLTMDPGHDVAALTGDGKLYGYQAYGPRIPVQPGQRMRLRVPVTVTAGRGCLGVLDETELRWILAPDRLLTEYEFLINDSRTVKPVLADCSGSPSAVARLRATVGSGSYALWSDREDLYVDQLMREFRNATPR